MKRLRKRIIPWTLAVLMALTCGASAAFASEDVQSVEGEAVGDTVSVEAEQTGVSQEDENTDVSPENENTDVSQEDENFSDGEPQTEANDNVRLGEGTKETGSTVQVNYVGFIERVQDSVRVFPGETAGFTTKLLRCESNDETGYWSEKIEDDYTVKWKVVQTDKENEGEATINYYSTSESKDTKRLDVTVNKKSPVSEISIRAEFYIGNKMVFNDQAVFLHVYRFIGKITDNCGGNEPAMPGDSIDYTFELGWKEYSEGSGEVIDIDTSEIKIEWEVELKDKNDDVDPRDNINDYVLYNVDDKKLHLSLKDKWVDEKKYVVIKATASTEDGEYSTSDERRIVLEKDVDIFETIDCFAEAGGEISINDLQPQVKRYNSQYLTGIKVKGYDFKFSDEYFLEIKDGSVPLEGVTIGRDGKTLKIPKVEAGRYVVCIIAEANNERIGMYYAPIYVVNKDAADITDDAAAGTAAGSGNDSNSDKDSAKTGDDAELALWLALMILAGAGITGTALYTRRKRTNE